MSAALPPDRDPELRRALALDVDAQAALLDEMFGGRTAHRGNAPTAPAFTPVGLKVYRSPRGALICQPQRFPEDVILGADSQDLRIQIEHSAFINRCQPRRPEMIDDLEAAIEAYGSQRGVVTIPAFGPPRTWTLDTLRTVINLMVRHLPPGGRREKDQCNVCASAQLSHIEVFRSWQPYGYSPTRRLRDGRFTARVKLAPDAAPALRQWDLAFGSDPQTAGRWAGGTLPLVDEVLRRFGARQGASPSVDQADADDDLDDIERIARRTLRGAKLLEPNRDTGSLTLEEKVRRLVTLDPDYKPRLEKIVDGLLQDLDGEA